MIQDPKLIDELINIIDMAHDEGLLTELIVTAVEKALIKNPEKLTVFKSHDEIVVDLFQDAAYELGLYNCGIGPH